ncbi:MAG TPA: SOS response-associated peptidase family protein, partial [Caldisericia bacterium]|nr:SOS response-associated peptidase family protein [Caldisericia bacterium]
TTMSNSLISNIHDRMPVILKQEDEKIWLDKNIDDIKTLTNILKPFDSDKMQMYRVSNKVNNPKNDSKELLDPIN